MCYIQILFVKKNTFCSKGRTKHGTDGSDEFIHDIGETQSFSLNMPTLNVDMK